MYGQRLVHPTWSVDMQRRFFSTLLYVAQTCTNKCKRKHDSDKMGEFKYVRLLINTPDEEYGLDTTTPDIYTS